MAIVEGGKSPRGDGHAVIVFPGLGAGDLSTDAAAEFPDRQGYDTYGWDLGLNFGPRKGVLEKSIERVQQIAQDSGRRVSLIGWSLGGIYAREFAKALPKPRSQRDHAGYAIRRGPKATNAWRLYEFASGHKLDDSRTAVASEGSAAGADHIHLQPHRWRRVLAAVAAARIEATRRISKWWPVISGLGLNPVALYAVADRLAQPEEGSGKNSIAAGGGSGSFGTTPATSDQDSLKERCAGYPGQRPHAALRIAR